MDHLTDLGRKVSNEIRAQEWAKRTGWRLLALNSRLGQMPAEQLDEICWRQVQDTLSDQWNRSFDVYALNLGVDKNDIAAVLKIRLREAITYTWAGAELLRLTDLLAE